MQKALEQMHRKRTEVGRASTGQPGMTSMRALLAGERAPQRVAPSRDKRGKPAQATIAKAVAGHWRAEQRCAWAQAMALRLAAQGVAHRHSALGA